MFGRLTCSDMKSIAAQLVLLICASFSRNNVCKKLSFRAPSFGAKKLWRWILTRCEFKHLLLAAYTARFFFNRCFYFRKKERNRVEKTIDRRRIEPVSPQNKLESEQFST